MGKLLDLLITARVKVTSVVEWFISGYIKLEVVGCIIYLFYNMSSTQIGTPE